MTSRLMAAEACSICWKRAVLPITRAASRNSLGGVGGWGAGVKGGQVGGVCGQRAGRAPHKYSLTHRHVSSRRTMARTIDPSITSVSVQISWKGVPLAHSYTTCSIKRGRGGRVCVRQFLSPLHTHATHARMHATHARHARTPRTHATHARPHLHQPEPQRGLCKLFGRQLQPALGLHLACVRACGWGWVGTASEGGCVRGGGGACGGGGGRRGGGTGPPPPPPPPPAASTHNPTHPRAGQARSSAPAPPPAAGATRARPLSSPAHAWCACVRACVSARACVCVCVCVW